MKKCQFFSMLSLLIFFHPAQLLQTIPKNHLKIQNICITLCFPDFQFTELSYDFFSLYLYSTGQ